MRGKIVGFIHAQLPAGQIADVAHAGFHHIFGAQKFFNGLHLGRRFHHDKIFAHGMPYKEKVFL